LELPDPDPVIQIALKVLKKVKLNTLHKFWGFKSGHLSKRINWANIGQELQLTLFAKKELFKTSKFCLIEHMRPHYKCNPIIVVGKVN
jgi:hypothetical protein